MPIDLIDREQYLSLALFAQEVISTLIEYVDQDNCEHLKSSLGEALDFLLQVRRRTTAKQDTPSTFTGYEHLRTMDEVWDAKKRKEIASMIREILRAPENKRNKHVADQLIDHFSRLQNQALWNFEQPKPVSPKVLTRLCRMA